MHTFNLMSAYSDYFVRFQIAIGLLSALLHIIFAAGVARDIRKLHRLHIETRFIPATAWILATLIAGILVLAMYWLMHHSTLARRL